MATPTIGQIRSQQTDFQKSYMWRLSFLRLPQFVTIQQSEAPDYWFNLLCLSTEVPKRTGQTSTIMIHGNQIFDPGIYNVQGTLQLVFVEQVDAPVRQFIMEWEQACTTKKGIFQDLTGDIRLVTLDNQKNDNWEYQMLWCFFEDSNIQALDGGNSDPMQPNITLKYTTFGEGPAGNVVFPE